MKLFYNPSFSGGAYVDFSKSPVLFDAKVVNTAGLCKILRLHAGICSNEKDYGTRFVDYYAAMKKFMEKNPDNVFASSFNIDKLNTAKQCLEWRDTLAAAGWTKTALAPTERTKALCGIEQFFNDKCTGEELWELVDVVINGCPLPELELIVPSYYEDFSPAEVALIKALIERGVDFTAEEVEPGQNNIAKIYSVLQGKPGIELDTSDDSFEIWNFAERDEAVKYLSLLNAKDFDVWINADNKEFDNWQKLEGKRLSGSQINGTPHTAQLLKIALTIFERPLNVYNIVEWLNTSPNPLHPKFRSELADCICSSGGYYNDTCREYIEKNIAQFPDNAKDIQKFLPDINKPVFDEGEVEAAAIREFVENLSNWCLQRLSQNKEGDPAIDQLRFVVTQADNLLLLLDELGSDTIPFEDITRITSAFTTDQSMTQYAAQAGSKKVISSYADFCDSADKTVWCDFYNCGDSGRLTYSFLVPAEQEAFKDNLQLWDTSRERTYLKNLLLTPFVKTSKKLVIVTLDKIGSDAAPKSPLYIQLEKYFADKEDDKDFTKNKLYPFVKHIKLDNSLSKEIFKVDNRMEIDQEFVEIKNTDYIKKRWPDHQSYSSFDNLIPHPLDYVIDKYADFSTNAVNTIKDIPTTIGSVAHKMIELLFAPKEGEPESGTPAYIKKQIEVRFDKVFKQTVQAEGAILLSKDNKLELQKVKKQIRTNLDELLKCIEANDLHVIECERKIGYKKEKGEVVSHGIIGNLDISGSIDMLLQDSNGKFFIFDFKRTSSSTHHASLLKENKSIQLSLYSQLLADEMKVKVEDITTAYFLIPAARFVSCNKLKGAINFQQINTNSDRKTSNLIQEIQNSYDYRKNEIFEGRLEETTGWAEEDITYEQKRSDLHLMPMSYYNNAKNGPYNDIGLIKARKQGE